MLKILFKIFKRLIVSVLFIYAYNKLALPLNLIMPINIVTVSLVALCGIPSILMLVLYWLLCI